MINTADKVVTGSELNLWKDYTKNHIFFDLSGLETM
jgi:hypothetical protein